MIDRLVDSVRSHVTDFQDPLRQELVLRGQAPLIDDGDDEVLRVEGVG